MADPGASQDADLDRACCGYEATPKNQGTVVVSATLGSEASSTSESSECSAYFAVVMSMNVLSRVTSTIRIDRTKPLDHLRHVSGETRPWLATWVRFGPLSGIIGPVLAVASMFASFGILAGSDRKPVEAWPSPPSTYLAIFTAIANLTMRYAAVQGVVIAWWLRAIKGTTLPKLHWDWKAGTTLRGALTSGRRMGLLGLACIFSTVVVVNGPLLQRSSTVVTASMDSPLNISMAAEIPTGFGQGMWYSGAFGGSIHYNYSMAFNDTVPTPHGTASNNIVVRGGKSRMPGLWWATSPLKGVARGCSGVCRIKLRAPAFFPTACSANIIPLEVKRPLHERVLNGETPAPLNQQAFLNSINLVVNGDREVINMVTGFGTMDHCEGTLNLTVCTLESGIGLYDLEVRDGDISLNYLEPPQFVALANNTAVNHTFEANLGGHLSTLSEFVMVATTRWGASVTYYQKSDGKIIGFFFGGASYEEYKLNSPGQCSSYLDPWEDILQGLNRMALYAGAETAQQDGASLMRRMGPDLPVNYTISYQDAISVFHTDYRFFLITAIVEFLCISLVAPTYWGWWRIGRPVSFSPLELAKAFESPMLSDCDSNVTGHDIAQILGEKEVKYGLAANNATYKKTKIALGDGTIIAAPRSGMLFDV